MFPTPIGGLVLPSEFAACLVFIVLYGLLLPLVAYRILDRRSRTFLLFGTIIFSVERIVLFSLRAVATRQTSWQLSNGVLKYMQSSFGTGFIGVANDLVNLIRCAIINPTYGPDRWDEAPASRSKESEFRIPEAGDEDHPIQRRRVRDIAGWTGLAFLSSNVPGIIAGTLFNINNFDDAEKAARASRLRYASSGVALFLIGVIVAIATWSRKAQRHHSIKAIYTTYALASLTGTVAVYRLAVMWNHIPTFDYRGPGSLNSVGAKTSFYIFHALPEWTAMALLLGLPIRKIYGTAFWGDYRVKDDTEEKRAKRRGKAEREAEKAAKEAEQDRNAVELREVSSTQALVR